MALKFHTIMAKGLKLKVRKFFGLIPTFVEVTGEKLVGGRFDPILNRVNDHNKSLFDGPELPGFIFLLEN